MTETQTHLLKLILEIDRICKKYDIQYFIDYGTTLGAVRHEGFIPWDDDIDITMTEDNYYKWVEACKKELDPDKRLYRDNRLDREYPTVFGRYNDLETARVGRLSEFWKPICGQCIDVFVLLPLPGDPVKKQEAIDLYFAYDEYSNSSYRHFRMKTERWMELYESFVEEEKKIGKEAVLQKLEKKIFHQHYDDCDTYIVNSARKKGPTSIVPKFVYDSVHYQEFEGHILPIPGKYIELLNVYYEDTYCMIPEHKKRHSPMSHSGFGCKMYVDDYMRFIDKDELLKQRQTFKHLDVEEGYRTTRLRTQFFNKMGQFLKLKIEKKIKEENIDLDAHMVIDRDKLKVLDDLFSEYYQKQMNQSTRAWDCYFDLGDKLIEAALYNLLYYRNDFYTIAKILYLREMNHFSKTEKMEEIWDAITTIRKIKAETIYQNYEEAKKLADYGMEHYPDNREIRISKANLDVILSESKEELETCRTEVKTLLADYGQEDQCIKILGDIAYKLEDYSTAIEKYNWISEHSLNGMLHLDVRKKMATIPEAVVDDKEIGVITDAPVAEAVNEYTMNPIQEKLVTLMDQLDEICKENNLRYILHNRTAGRAKANGKFTNNTYQMEILMPFGDAFKFKEIVEKNLSATRAIEDWTNNEDLCQLMFRFVDKESTLIDVSAGNYYKKPGVAILIYVAKALKGDEKVYGCERLLQMLNNAGKQLEYTPDQIVKIQRDVKIWGEAKAAKKYKIKDIKTFLNNKSGIRHGRKRIRKGKDRMASWVMSEYAKREQAGMCPQDEWWYMTRGGIFMNLPKDIFDHPGKVKFENRTYNIAREFEKHMEIMFHANWQKKCLESYRTTGEIFRAIFDANIPYEEYLAYIKNGKYSNPEWTDMMLEWRDYNIWLKKKHKPAQKKVDHTFAVVRRSVDRIDTWYKLKDKRDAIKAATEAKDVQALTKLLGKYLERTEYFKTEGIGFYIDEELFDAAKLVWTSEGRENYADEVYALVPELYRTERVEDLIK